MGTRSLTFVYDSYKDQAGKIVQDPIINMYRQYDGYPTGHGAELAKFLAAFEGENPSKSANGWGCFAAQLVVNFKLGEGGIYLYPTSAVDCGQDYEYHIYNADEKLRIAVTDRGCNFFGLTMSNTNKSIFEGNLAEFIEFCTEKEEA